MYYAGKPYGQFSETINAVAGRRPAIRKALVQAWDLAFAWQADERRERHPAMPLSVLLALCSLALLWGWPHEAAIFSFTWSGILRIGETLAATRGDLILPCDAAPGTTYALLRILQPKTRGRLAKHQSPELIQLMSSDFSVPCIETTTLMQSCGVLLPQHFAGD